MKTHTQLVKRFIVTLLFSTLLLVFPNSPTADSLEAATQAYKAGDYKKALEILKPLAENGHASAQYNLGIMYDNGRGVPQDYAEAVKWYRKAAENGHASAQNNLGLMYNKGQGVPQDYAEAVKWYRKAAENGHASAQYNLGIMYDNGRGVPQDDAKAVKWYRMAAEQGLALAQSNLGWMYTDGKGVPQDYIEAHKWLDLATYRLPPGDDQKKARKDRDLVEKKMTAAQVAEAQKLAREWKITMPPWLR